MSSNVTNVTNGTNVKINYNSNYVKYCIMADIKNIIFKWNGIIFGGFVRDSIIHNHYANIFYNKFDDYKSMWNEQFDIDTLPRTIVPNDIDVCLYDRDDINNMIKDITQHINNKFGMSNVTMTSVEIIYSVDDKFDKYIAPCSGILHNYQYTISIGKIPYVTEGIVLNVNLDIIECKIKGLSPPFRKLDFICNGFIMTKNDLIYISPNTGTDIDKLTFVQKKEIEYKIIRDIVNFKTDYCLDFSRGIDSDNYTSTSDVRLTEQACRRIEKMVLKKNMWTIGNMPFIIDKNCEEFSNKNCCICCDSFKKKDRVAYVPFNGQKTNSKQYPPMHAECLFKYLNSQIRNIMEEINNSDLYLYDSVFLKCPMRNMLNFDCRSIKNVIDNYLLHN